MPLNIEKIRQQFPALLLKDGAQPRIYFDNPGGTQVPQQVIDRMTDYLIQSNANHAGFFRTSQRSDEILSEAHQAMADLLNAASASEIIFGPNMTTLTYHISRSLAKWFKPGDEIILTRMDHDANVMPWYQMANDLNLDVKWLPFDTNTYRFNLDELQMLLTKNVKLVAINYASNAIGTINDIKKITEMAHSVGAYVYVDAVQYIPHGITDVQDLGCDFLVCSPYKFFGPHQGVLWGKYELLETLPPYKVRPADDDPPGKFETGTQSHEGQAGTLGALEYLTWIGQEMGKQYHQNYQGLNERTTFLHAGLESIREYEKELSTRLIDGLSNLPNVLIHGITQKEELDYRVPTVSFSVNGVNPADIARYCGQHNIFVWHGHYYALEVINQLGLEELGGMVRIGAVHYNTIEEINTLLEILEKFLT